MLKDKSLTYVTLFSSAGVGCHGFQMEGYHCIATNEIIERRMQVQRCNHKCEFDSGYIVGDITSDEIKQRIYDEIHRWEKKGNDRVDVIIATPPCQGISVINHKKNGKEINRNSLVVESVEIIRRINPRFFILENVMAFQKTLCIIEIRIVIYCVLWDERSVLLRYEEYNNYFTNCAFFFAFKSNIG